MLVDEDSQSQTQLDPDANTQPPLQSTSIRSDIGHYIHQADWVVISHVETFGCIDLFLKLSILDLKTRIVETDRASKETHAENLGAVRKTDELVRLARDVVIRYVRQNGCGDVELKMKVLDLETRIMERGRIFIFST